MHAQRIIHPGAGAQHVPTPWGQMVALHKQSLLLLLPSWATGGQGAARLPSWMVPFLLLPLLPSSLSPFSELGSESALKASWDLASWSPGTLPTQPESEGGAFYRGVTCSLPCCLPEKGRVKDSGFLLTSHFSEETFWLDC